jgi:hypothetical protein
MLTYIRRILGQKWENSIVQTTESWEFWFVFVCDFDFGGVYLCLSVLYLGWWIVGYFIEKESWNDVVMTVNNTRGEHRVNTDPNREIPKPNFGENRTEITRFGSGRVGFGRFCRFLLFFSVLSWTEKSRNRIRGKPKPSKVGSVSIGSLDFGRFCSP